jgi:undecaprenyl-diphosphatase
VILQGIIQGFTEFLPISSSGHLSLFQYFFGLSGEESLSFSIVLHLGTLFAVFIAFGSEIARMIKSFLGIIADIFTGKFKPSMYDEGKRTVLMTVLALLPLLLIVFLKDAVSAFSADDDIIVEGICFIITGVMIYVASKVKKGNRTARNMTAKDSLLIGTAQTVAVLPGISRSGATFSMGLMLGFEREFCISFSFILGIPAILGSAVLEIPNAVVSGNILPFGLLATGFLTSALFGFLSIKLVKWLITTDRYVYFSYYTVALGAFAVISGIIKMNDMGV